MNSRQSQFLRRWAPATALLAAVSIAPACDSLLEVELPSAVTEEALDNPATAPLQVNSVMASIECAYSGFTLNAAGYEDNFQRVSGVAGTYSEYPATPGQGATTNGIKDPCDGGQAYSSTYYEAFLIGRAQGKTIYDRLSGYTDAQVPNRTRLLGQTALYTGIALDVFGEFWCETAVDEGPLMTPTQTLALAEEWINKAITHIDATGDYALTTAKGTIAPSAKQLAIGLRARTKWARGDLAGAAADAALVPNGFVGYILREGGQDRRNTVYQFQGTGTGLQAAGFLQGPVTIKTSANAYGVSALGNNPVTGQPWPSTIPFTGYLNLGIESGTGLTIDANGYPFTTTRAGTVADSRVTHVSANTAGGNLPVITKYTSYADDIPLLNWREMRLIQAQYQNQTVNNQAAAIALINQLRTAANLPQITGSYSQDYVKKLIIEERRRALWLEGRFWATKIQNPDLLWFPRLTGDWVNSARYVLGGGVRLLMYEDEYQINPNLSLADRATGCAAPQRPIVN